MKKYVLSVLSAFVITACGSSGGGGNNDTAAPPSNETAITTEEGQNTTSPTTSNIANTINTPNTFAKGEGNNYLTNVSLRYLSNNPIQFKNPDNLSEITVEGKTFDLLGVSRDGVNAHNWLRVIGGNIRTGQDNLPTSVNKISAYISDNLVVGILSSNITRYWHEYAYINGKFTDANAIPKGSASYTVNVPMFSHTERTVADYSRQSKLEVNFDEKTVKGEIKTIDLDQQPATTLSINAKITGSQFASDNNDPLIVKGGFFGENANEIGGIFKTRGEEHIGSHIGAFAGKKDN